MAKRKKYEPNFWWVILFWVAIMGRAMFIWMLSAVDTLEKGSERLRNQLVELRDITEEGCIDLLLQ